MKRLLLILFSLLGLLSVSPILEAQSIVFMHDAHAPNSYLTDINGHSMQAVHEYRQVVYVKPGSSITLHRPANATFTTYNRWYDYATDSLIPDAQVNYATTPDYKFERGAFYKDKTRELTVTYTLPTRVPNMQIACDQSSYTDAVWNETRAHGADTGDTVRLLTYQDVRNMQNGETKTIILASTFATYGYVLGYDRGVTGLVYGSSTANRDTLDNVASRIAKARNTVYYMTLTKTTDGKYKIVSAKDATKGVDYNNGKVAWNSTPESMTLINPTITDQTICQDASCNVGFSLSVTTTRPNKTTTYYFYANQSSASANFSSNTDAKNYAAWNMYEVLNPNEFKALIEPTLSQRLVFDIRPASEMAARVDACVAGTNNWLEEHHIVAPTGNQLYLGPDYEFLSGDAECYYPNYYCNASNPTLLSGKNVWKWNNTNITNDKVDYGRYYPVSSNSEGTVTYKLTATYNSTTYQIAKFVVEYIDRAKIGPLETLQDEEKILDGTYLLAEQNFNYAGGRVGTQDGSTFYNIPLLVEESNYGFFRAKNYENKTAPIYTQYSFVNSSAFFGYSPQGVVLYNHGENANTANASRDAEKGYMMFIDGCPRPGDLFSLDLKVSLCRGSKMYFSAYVGDLSTADKSAPNFDFVLLGVDDDGKEDVLYTYTTGEFGYNAAPDIYHHKTAKWLHILFPLTIEQNRDYDTYRLKITNKGHSSDGNDFVIDDICVYAQMPPVMPIQAMVEPCSEETRDLITTYLRVDYEANNQHYDNCYYQWRNMVYNDSSIITATYWDEDHCSTEMLEYGHVVIPETPSMSDTVSDFARFDALYHDTDTALVKYIWENVGNGEYRWVLYIAQPMPFLANYRYTSFIVAAPEDFIGEVNCGMSADLLIAGGTRISVDGEIGTESFEVCGKRSYTMALEMSYVMQEGATFTPISVQCEADWLFGDSTFVNTHQSLYLNANFHTIQEAIIANHEHTTSAEQKALLQGLQMQDLLVLRVDSLEIVPMGNTNGIMSYTAFAVPGTAKDLDGKPRPDLVICELPRTVQFTLPSGDENMVMVGTREEVLPEYVTQTPRRIRMSDAQRRRGYVDMQVYLAGDTSKLYSVTAALLIKSNYPDWKTVFGSEFRIDSIKPNIIDKNTDSIRVVGANFKELVAGYDYTFVMEKNFIDLSGNECSNGNTYFTLRIVPDVVTWQTDSATDAWNNDANWSSFVPLSETNVILSPGEHCVSYPVAHDMLQMVDLEANAQDFISYDLGYQPYTCDSIYIPAKTTLVNQHLLDIHGLSFLDMALPNSKWNLVSFPIRGVFSGDIYIPENELTTPFDTKRIVQNINTYAADRIAIGNPYQVVFSKMVSQAYGASINSATWTIPWNELGYYYVPGNGLSVKLDNGGTGSSILRLPKFNSTYYYYMYGDWTNSVSPATISRPADAGKPGYIPTGVKGAEGQSFTLTNAYKGKKFLFGNPTFSSLDVGALLEINDDVVEPIFYLMTSDDSYIANVGTIAADGKTHYLLSLGGACFVNSKDSAMTISLTVTPDMLTTSTGSIYGGDPSVLPSPKRLDRVSRDRRRLHIAASAMGYVSYAAVVESSGAYDTYLTSEDAELMMLDDTRTPFAIYTLVNHAALSINQIHSLSRIPLCQYTMTESSVDTVDLEFYGDDDYVAEWDLVDSWEGKRWHLKDVKNVRVAIPQDGRRRFYLEHYYEQDAPQEKVEEELQMSYYVLDDEVVVFANQDMNDFTLYDVLGRLLYKHTTPTQIVKIWLPAGTYMVSTNNVVLKLIKQY